MWLPLFGILAASVVLYRSTLRGYFLGDDFGYIQLYAHTTLLEFATLFAADWSQGIWGFNLRELRPLVGITYWLEYRMWGTEAFGYHLGNHFFHATALAGLYLFVLESARGLVRESGVPLPLLHLNAAVATLLFLVHPAHVEAVAWIAGRTDLLAAMAYGWSMYFLARFWREGAPLIAVAAVAVFIAGLFVKENVITVPAMFGVYVLLAGGIITHWKRLLAVSAPLAAAAVGWILLRWYAFGAAMPIDVADAFEAFLTRLPFYAQQGLPHYSPAPVLVSVLLLALAGYALVVWNSFGRMIVFWSIAWTVLHMAPLMSVTYQSPRHIFLASGGPLVALSTVATLMIRKRLVVAGCIGLVCVLLLFRFTQHTSRALPVWETSAARSRQLAQLLRDGRYPDGAVVVIGSGPSSAVWFWHWALPFAVERPFMDFRARLVAVPDWYCCADLREARAAILAEVAAGAVQEVYHIEFNPHTDRFEHTTATAAAGP